jgi:hypothetical protein
LVALSLVRRASARRILPIQAWKNSQRNQNKKQGATGITTVAPYIAGQWGRGNNRLPE